MPFCILFYKSLLKSSLLLWCPRAALFFYVNSRAQNNAAQLFPIKGDEGIQISLFGEGLVRRHENQDKNKSADKAPEVKQAGTYEKQNPAKFNGVAHF